ncbi:MAG: hypothetical protein WCQ45_01065 [bacterium]
MSLPDDPARDLRAARQPRPSRSSTVWGSTYFAIRLAVRREGGFLLFALGFLRLFPTSITM